VVHVADTGAQDPRAPAIEALHAQGMRAYISVPMMAENVLVGSLSLCAREPHYFTEEHIEFARAIADHLGLAIQQSDLREHIGRQALELEQKVIERTAQLQAANDDLRSFSYTVSHDLRAPLRSIQGFAGILQESQSGRLDEEGLKLLGIIRKSAQRMDELIRDLLSFSQTGQARISVSRIEMTMLVREVWAGLERSAGVELHLADLPAAQADYALMRQVWINLLSNAIKYSGKRDAPCVRVSAVEQAHETTYCVADNGAGFEPRYAEKLFKVFQRLHSESEFSGTGVGLAIVHRIVTRHGGRVWAEGAPDAGARFYFCLPKGEHALAGGS
jgi:light-regulated signal transduction histidine kinase (bacteriophytochrome)